MNRELLRLYWQIGRDIVLRQEQEGWGASVIERLARDLQSAFPGVAGFSSRNIWRMRAFYLAHRGETEILPQPVAELAARDLPAAVPELPWGHQAVLIEKVKNSAERGWYARMAVEHGWSRNILVHQIESGLHQRQGRKGAFQPEYAGKMNFYLSAADDLLRHPGDQSSLGLILCKEKNRILVEYALRDTQKPIGVSGYRLTDLLPEPLQGSLPTIEQLEAEFAEAEE